jgi:hypothetical protein
MLFSPASFDCQRQSLKRHKKPRHPAFCKVLNFRKCLAPWDPLPLTPPRASQPTRSSYFGGCLATAPIVPPPRRRASPTHKKSCCVCSLRSLQSLRSQTLHKRLKGGGTAPNRSCGLQSKKKANVHVGFFSVLGRLPASPAANPPQRVVLRPPSFSSSHHAYRTSPNGKPKVLHFRKLRSCNLYPL